MSTEPKFKLGDRVKQYATHPDRDYFGFVERVTMNVDPPEYYVRWHRGFATVEAEADLEQATPISR